jgi:hypothetical protein
MEDYQKEKERFNQNFSPLFSVSVKDIVEE